MNLKAFALTAALIGLGVTNAAWADLPKCKSGGTARGPNYGTSKYCAGDDMWGKYGGNTSTSCKCPNPQSGYSAYSQKCYRDVMYPYENPTASKTFGCQKP
jgi:hypothetical protein